jgi:hypothetical protein
MPKTRWEVFISHASEDKDSIAFPLAEALRSYGISVWLDVFHLSVGDRLQFSLDYAIRESKYGIVILSSDFFSKKWPQAELAALFARESEGEKIILPVWHGLGVKDLLHFSPIMADRISLSSSIGIDRLVSALLPILSPHVCIESGLRSRANLDHELSDGYRHARTMGNRAFAAEFAKLTPQQRFVDQERISKRHLAYYGIPISVLKRLLREVSLFSGPISEEFTFELVRAIESVQSLSGDHFPDGITGSETLNWLLGMFREQS